MRIIRNETKATVFDFGKSFSGKKCMLRFGDEYNVSMLLFVRSDSEENRKCRLLLDDERLRNYGEKLFRE